MELSCNYFLLECRLQIISATGDWLRVAGQKKPRERGNGYISIVCHFIILNSNIYTFCKISHIVRG